MAMASASKKFGMPNFCGQYESQAEKIHGVVNSLHAGAVLGEVNQTLRLRLRDFEHFGHVGNAVAYISGN